MAQIVVSTKAAGKTCPYCRFPLKSGLQAEACDSCGAIHHAECWDEGGGCAVFGCAGQAARSASEEGVGVPVGAVTSPEQMVQLEPVRRTRPMDVFSSSPASFRTGVEIDGLPLELWGVIGLIGLAGIYLLQLSLRAVPDSVRALTNSSLSHGLTLVLLVLVLLVGALGAGFLWLAWELRKGNRVARGLTYVAVACLSAAVIFGDAVTTGQVLSMLGGLAAAAILGLSPAVKPIFRGSSAPDADQPAGVVVARVSLAIWMILLGLAALLNLALLRLDGKYAAIGVLEGAIVVAAYVMYRRLGLADRRARVIVSVGAGIAFIVLLFGLHATGFTVLVGLTAAIPISLWLPSDVRAFYGDEPLAVTRYS